MKKISKLVTAVLFASITFGISGNAVERGACYIRVQYGPVLPDPEHLDSMMETHCFSNLTEQECYERADKKNFSGLVYYVFVLGWKKNFPCQELL